MYKEFFIKKQSGTYAETLEAFGVANLVAEILQRSNIQGFNVTFEDKGIYYLVSSNKAITSEMLTSLKYFQVVKFVKKEATQTIPNGILDFFDYPNQKSELDNYKKRFEEIEKNKQLNQEQKKIARKALNKEKTDEFGKLIDAEFDVYREIIKNPYVSFSKLFENFYQNQSKFSDLITEILNFYVQKDSIKRTYKLSEEKPTAQQIFNPNQGKGLNKNKANNVSMGNLDSNWIAETMKTSGAFSMMICQYVKVGSTYDLKLFVPEFHKITISEAKNLVVKFKKYLKSTSPVKLDVLNILDFTKKYIEETPQYKGKVKNTVKGFHSVYQKDLGQNKAVANIAFINTPNFVEYETQDEAGTWTEILEQQRNIISGIEELGDAIQGLQSYRSFLGSIGQSALEHFSKFSYWYASYLMQALVKEKYYVKPFRIETLNKFYNNMESNLLEIINNEGFKAVSMAIRKSTVSLQYTPKDQRKFEIRYGLAQNLQNKSKSKEDLAIFIGEFIGMYNAETGRSAEKNGGKAFRSNVKDSELILFYEIISHKKNVKKVD